jgi:glutaminase
MNDQKRLATLVASGALALTEIIPGLRKNPSSKAVTSLNLEEEERVRAEIERLRLEVRKRELKNFFLEKKPVAENDFERPFGKKGKRGFRPHWG